MSVELDRLTVEVEKNTTVDQSAIQLLNGLSQQIAQLKNDPVALQKLADSLSGSSAELAAAVVANTPGAPNPNPPPVPVPVPTPEPEPEPFARRRS